MADRETHFPCADLKFNDPEAAKFATATCEIFKNERSMSVPTTTDSRHDYNFQSKHAPVTMPIVSTGLLADEDGDVLYRKNDGVIFHPDGSQSKFVRLWGVGFTKLKVPTAFLVGDKGKMSQCLTFGRQR